MPTVILFGYCGLSVLAGKLVRGSKGITKAVFAFINAANLFNAVNPITLFNLSTCKLINLSTW